MQFLTIMLLQASAAADAVAHGLPPADFLDDLIAICIVLFILSGINEKITQLIRNYAPFKIGSILGLKKLKIWQNVGKNAKTWKGSSAKVVEREVNSLSFFTGLIIASAFHVNLFKMIGSSNPRGQLFWDAPKWHSYLNPVDFIVLILSLGLTGFFLTFGSKFFHDLLDLLFEVKNAKKKLADDNTFKAENTEQLDTFLHKSYSDIINSAISQNVTLLSNPDMVGSPSHGKMLKNNRWVDCIDINLKGHDRGTIPLSVNFGLSTGQTITVPVNVVTGLGEAAVHGEQGSQVSASEFPKYKGTICCMVQTPDKLKKLVTCSHVMMNGGGYNNSGQLSKQVPSNIDGQPDGHFVWAKRNAVLDMALLQCDINQFVYQVQPKKERALSPDDLMKKVKIVRQGGNVVESRIINHCIAGGIPINYDGQNLSIFNLIRLANVTIDGNVTTYSPPTQQGDSGACVYDMLDSPIGMIIAGDEKYSYAVAITRMLKDIDATIITS